MMLDKVDQGIVVLDPELRLKLWNQRAVELLGAPVHLWRSGKHVSTLISHFYQERGLSSEDVRATVAARVEDFKHDHVKLVSPPSFLGRTFERRARRLDDGSVVLTYIDVTAAAQREQRLQEQARLLSATLSNMEQGILVMDEALNILAWNDRIVRIFGLPNDYLQSGQSVRELIRFLAMRGGRTATEADRLAVVRAEGFRQRELVVLSGADAAGRIVERRSRPLPDGGYVAIYTDVTELRRREHEIAEKSAMLAKTLDNMDQGLLVIDGEDRVTLWNDRLVEMFGLPAALLEPHRPFKDILEHFARTSDIPTHLIEAEVAARLAELHSTSTSVADFSRPSGRVFERRSRLTADGGRVITYSDVTERRNAERDALRSREEAELANRSKTEFLANMSHELRTPLNAIIGFSDVLAHEMFGPLGSERYVAYAKDVHESGQHLLSLINDVLDVAKIEVKKIVLAEEPVECGAIIDACLRLVQERAASGNVELEARVPPDMPWIFADKRRLKQILLNLLSNAVKFTPAGGRIEISVDADRTGVRFIVADTGIGIAEADLDQALAPFGQIDSRLARRYEGTGLGLPLARSMTELHGGRLDIVSRPQQGTTVTVWLPPERILSRSTARLASA